MDTSNAKKIAIKAFRAAKGNVTDACSAAQIARSTFYKWMHEDVDFKTEVDEIKEELIDFFEKQLVELAKGAYYDAMTADGDVVRLQDKPNPTSVIFALKTLGKHRGYVEKQEIDMNVQPLVINSAVDGPVNETPGE